MTVNNVAPTMTISGADTVDEGSVYTLTLGPVVDPGTDTVSQYVIHWGDGADQTIPAAGLPANREVTHTYADGPSSPTITVDLTDEDGTYPGMASKGIVVNNVAPTVEAGPDQVVNEGDTVTLGSIPASGRLLRTFADPNPNSWGGFGFCIATIGDDVLVGAPWDNSAYLFDGATGGLLRTFQQGGGRFGYSIATVGDKIAISAVDIGQVYLFDVNGNPLRTFVKPPADGGSQFGVTVAWIGDDLLIGAQSEYTGPGTAYLFDATTGDLLRTFGNPSGQLGCLFGAHLAPMGNNAIIPAVYYGYPGTQYSGIVYLIDSTNGNLLQTFANPTPETWDLFGNTVLPVGNNVLISAIYDSHGNPSTSLSGTVYLFDSTSGTLIRTFDNPTPAHGADFGVALAAVGNALLIGACYNPYDRASGPGESYLFDLSTGTLLQTLQAPTPTSGDGFGACATTLGNNFLVSAVYSQYVYLFEGPHAGATFTDPGFDNPAGGTMETFTATIDWGDGTPPEPGRVTKVNGGPGVLTTGTVNGSHVYADDGTYKVTVTVTDDDGAPGSDFFMVTVNNVAPTMTISGPECVDEGSVYTLTLGPVVDPGTDTVSQYLIHWGDGIDQTIPAADLPANREVTHTYADGPSGPTITVDLTDEDGTYPAVASKAVTVNSLPPSRLQGLVWEDFNDDGEVNFGEKAIEGVQVQLTGTDYRGRAVDLIMATDSQGIFEFPDLRPGEYTLTETQPADYADGKDSLGTVNGNPAGDASVNDQFSGIILPQPGSDGVNYNFGERPGAGGQVTSGQTATIGYWQNKNGQALIKSLNGGPASMQLGAWLAATFPNMYGASAGGSSLSGMSNSQVADLYTSLFKRTAKTSPGGPPKLDAQVMATALAVYVTNEDLAGTTAASYGFLVTEHGVGISTFDVGDANRAAFGLSATDSTVLAVIDILLATDSLAHDGLLYDQNDNHQIDSIEQALRTMANEVYSAINEQGHI